VGLTDVMSEVQHCNTVPGTGNNSLPLSHMTGLAQYPRDVPRRLYLRFSASPTINLFVYVIFLYGGTKIMTL